MKDCTYQKKQSKFYDHLVLNALHAY